MQKGDRISELILRILQSSPGPLETKEVLALVQNKTPCTRSIVFKRLNNLRGDGLIKGTRIGSGKGVWAWWRVDSFKEKSSLPILKHDRVITKILEILNETDSPLETKEVEVLVQHASPKSTRAIVFKRLTELRRDGAIKGKHVGSGKGVWIWWRDNAFEA